MTFLVMAPKPRLFFPSVNCLSWAPDGRFGTVGHYLGKVASKPLLSKPSGRAACSSLDGVERSRDRSGGDLNMVAVKECSDVPLF